MANPVIYRGIKFPFAKGSTSFPEAATDEALIENTLKQLFGVMQGERVMRPEFGSKVLSALFENNDGVLSGALRAEVQGLVAKYEPRVQIRDVEPQRRGSETSLLISYVVLSTGRLSAVTVGLPSV